MQTIRIIDWTTFLRSRVNIDVYVYGGNGQSIIVLMPKICNMEKGIGDVDRVLTLLAKRLASGIDIHDICGEDCSGLAIKKLVADGILPYDMTANGIWEYIIGTDKIKPHGKQIPLSEARAGDFLFEGSDTNKWHIGYDIGDGYAIESQNHDVGVVETKKSERKWKYAARPNWYSDSPEPAKKVLRRELKYTNPMMRGEDVEMVQDRLNYLTYSCGTADGIFGKKTDIAVRNFQSDKSLTVDGIIGKNTAEALGFIWEG